MIQDYFRLAYQSARHRKLRSWLTMIGIFIGIAAVVALISLSQGLRYAISEQFVQLGSDKIIIQGISSGFGPPGTGVEAPLTIKDKEVIEKVNGVDIAVGRLVRSAKISFGDEVKYSFIVSMPEDNEEIKLAIEANNYKIGQGRLLQKGDKFKVLLGSGFAEDFFDKGLILRDKIEIEDVDFKVVGILKKSGNPQQDSTLVIPEATFREILDIKEAYDIIPTKISAGEDIAQVTERIEKALRKHRDVAEGKEDFNVETPENILATLNTILTIVQGVLIGIAAISLVVGGIGIMNTMYTSVLERTKEIGIMKAIGARNKEILSLFIIESGMLGLIGGIIGVSIGFGISKSVEYIAFQVYDSFLIKANITFTLLIGALLFAFIVGAVSGALPAKQAASLKPVDALRK
ncbi:MAG: ABC transporter permease [Nanoarchaeota archaeon]|nr:ABC transporter permease [Nanoarchaeota archaeon]MBU1632778.1 ABC transporter permease [Nanoarchaeota archaeon]MBU1876726.1 ABC transporter permease [Nanoarchaeota archaeon]